MRKTDTHIPVIIVGGGPVGLFLAICLLKKGIECRVLEKRHHPVSDSRSLGIHPVSLELFDKLHITEPFLEKGIKIKRGLAFSDTSKLGEISFEQCALPHNYILACPQFYTEQILRNELERLTPNALLNGTSFRQFYRGDDSITVEYRTEAESHQLKTDYLVGCDGKNSTVRQMASIAFNGKQYPDTYIMGDFHDNTSLGSDAAVYLCKDGLIESFPLPKQRRRWVVKTDGYFSNPEPENIMDIINQRINVNLSDTEFYMISSFRVQQLLASQFSKGRVLLAGDAAHVVSPIGGQGMNLGWLGAWRVAEALSNPTTQNLTDYSKSHSKTAKIVARRAEFNMIMGRRPYIPSARNLLIRTMLSSPFSKTTARFFTMRNL